MSQYAASITVRLRAAELADVERLAAERGWSRSDVLRAAVATPQGISDPVEAIAGLVRRMHVAEAEREVLRLTVERSHQDGEQRVRDMQAEFTRREAGLVKAVWRALGQEPGTDRQLLEAVARAKEGLRALSAAADTMLRALDAAGCLYESDGVVQELIAARDAATEGEDRG